MTKILRNLLVIISVFGYSLARAEHHDAVLMYIQPFEYQNEVRLWHFSQDHWFAQGPYVEQAAQEKLSALYGNVEMCDSNQSAKLLIWLQPKMFYNAQLQVFYGQVTANVYTGVGKLVGSYEGKSRQLGSLLIRPEVWLKKSYETAVDDMMAKMQADPAIQNAMQQPVSTETETPCSMVTLLPVPKLRAMSF